MVNPKPCERCNERFQPNSFEQKLCNKCHDEINITLKMKKFKCSLCNKEITNKERLRIMDMSLMPTQHFGNICRECWDKLITRRYK